MNRFSVTLEWEIAEFYRKIAEQSGLPIEQVLSDSLFHFAGELSLHAINAKKQDNKTDTTQNF